MLSATLVALQGFPGLALFFAGAVPRKWALTSAFMALYAMAWLNKGDNALRHARRPAGLPRSRPLLRRRRPPQVGAHLRIHGALRHGRHNMAFGRRLLPFVGRPAPALAQD
uniref:Uncharacterized protein n=1 Tax=Oryza glumipatula TaxID=40148 RepID=A0A0E0BEE8_9ORYZ